MSDVTVPPTQPADESGSPTHFGIVLPGWWPRLEPVFGPIDQPPAEPAPEQAELIAQLLADAEIPAGTRCVAAMMTAENEPRPFGAMYINHSAEAGAIMAGMVGVEVAADDLSDLRSVGSLEGVELSVIHFDEVGSVSCVTARRRNTANPDVPDTLIRAYLIPEPKSLRAAMVLYTCEYQEGGVEAVCDMCDLITASFSWHWG